MLSVIEVAQKWPGPDFRYKKRRLDFSKCLISIVFLVPIYGNQSNIKDTKSRNLTEAWKAAKDHVIGMDFEQCDELFETLDQWNECLEKPSALEFITPAPDKEP